VKYSFFILFLSISLFVSGKTYYVATTGKDSNPGTITQPWLTWEKAFHTALAGDTVYFRGGIYNQMVTTGGGLVVDPRYPVLGHNGTKGNPICFLNFPGEIPILDCKNVHPSSNYNKGISFKYLNYVHVKGLSIRNVFQVDSGVIANAFIIENKCNNVTIENVTINNVGGVGFACYDYDTVYFKNCDVYNCADSISFFTEGEYGTGYDLYNTLNDYSYVEFYGCRAWNCSDNGFGGRAWGTEVFDSCWSFND
jgi:hypothetical protein